jgi:hypothetical protein
MQPPKAPANEVKLQAKPKKLINKQSTVPKPNGQPTKKSQTNI